MKTLGYAVILLICYVFPAQAQQVPHDCAAPPSTFRNVWYIDPVNGATQAAGGNGSQAHPWNSLEAVFQTMPGYAYPLLTTAPYRYLSGSSYVFATGPKAGPIKPGDEILLMSGNYGNITIGDNETEITNSSFLTIAAAPGQSPVLSQLYILSTNMLAFNGLKVEGTMATAASITYLVEVKDQGPDYQASNIVFENMTISTLGADDSWTQAQWLANGRNGFAAQSSAGGGNTRCISMAGSHITEIRNGALLNADLMLFSGNQIDHFGDDGIDYAGTDLTITNNYIHDNFNAGDGNHEDAMQGVIGVLATGVAVNTYSYITIDNNTIIRQTDQNLQFPTGLQGIDAFDSDWQYVWVTNNVVVTSACWGIYFASLQGGSIMNNTVVNDGALPSGDCQVTIAVGSTTHEGSSSSSVTVRNNIASALNVDNLLHDVEADHNVAIGTANAAIATYVNSVATWYSKPGTYGTNIIAPGGPQAEFVEFNPTTLTYNMMLKAGAPAITAGTAAGAPTVDILGVTRATTSPNGPTAGAYGFPE